MSEPHTILTLNSHFPFGKYKGKTVQHVLDINPEYIAWFGREVRGYAFATEVAPAYKKAMHYCSPAMMTRVYTSRVNFGEDIYNDDEYDENFEYADGNWGGLTDDDMRMSDW